MTGPDTARSGTSPPRSHPTTGSWRSTPTNVCRRSSRPKSSGSCARDRTRGGYRMPRMLLLPRALDSGHRLVSRLSASALRPPRRPLQRQARPRVGRAEEWPAGNTRAQPAALSLPRHLRPRHEHRSLHDARRRGMVRRGPPHEPDRSGDSPAGGLPAQLRRPAGLSRRDGGVPDLDPQLVLRVPQDPQALGTAARLSHAGPGRSARREQRAAPPEVRAHTQRRRPKSLAGGCRYALRRHGGHGCCAGRPSTRRRPPAVDVLAPHRHGANVAWWSESGARHRPRPAVPRPSDDARRTSRRRASPARARGPRPHSAGAQDRDGSQRGLAPVTPPQAAQARHRPCPRPARGRHGRAGALDEHAAGQATARGVAPRRLPPAQQFPVALEVPAGRLLHLRVGSDSANARGRRRAGSADGDRSRRHRPRAHGGRRPSTCTKSCSSPIRRRWSAMSPRWCRTKVSDTSSKPPRSSCARSRTRAS